MEGTLLPGKLLVEKIEEDVVTPSGIIISMESREFEMPNFIGRIVLTGAYTTDDIATVGDKIAFSKLSGTKLEIYGKEYIVMSQKDILYKYEEPVS